MSAQRVYTDYLSDILIAATNAQNFVAGLHDPQECEKVYVGNVVIHEYFGVDYEVLWRTVHEDLPPSPCGGQGHSRSGTLTRLRPNHRRRIPHQI